MSALDIIEELEKGRPGTPRLGRLRTRVSDLDRACQPGALLDVLCSMSSADLHGFVGNVLRMPEPAAHPRGLTELIGFVEGIASGALRYRVELRNDPFETRPLPQSEESAARRKLGLARGEWSDEAEAEARRLHGERERPLVLYPAGSGPAATIREIVEAIALNEAQAASRRVRRGFINKIRLNVLANRRQAA